MTVPFWMSGVLTACVLATPAGVDRDADRRQMPSPPAATDPVVFFEARLAEYIALRAELIAQMRTATEPPDESTVFLDRRRLGETLRAKRAGITAGNIFSGAVARYFRARAAETMQRATFRAWLELRAQHPPLRARVNESYPWFAGHDVAIALLRRLPELPSPIVYRVVGNDLVLWDHEADVVIDVLRDCFATVTI